MTNLYISFNSERQPYKFGGKELDEMHGLNWYDQGARPFDAIIPRTPTIDPMAEMYYSTSPYVQWGNNPVNYVDLCGDSLTLVGSNTHDAKTKNPPFIKPVDDNTKDEDEDLLRRLGNLQENISEEI
jgi:RHS repeat-associated protein